MVPEGREAATSSGGLASEGRLEALPTLPPVRLTPKAAPKFKYPKPKDDASAVGGGLRVHGQLGVTLAVAPLAA
ncbi:hypothetical protein HaLaN_10656, partial [Haematococcus lacustris]